jgi:hypothetical protein
MGTPTAVLIIILLFICIFLICREISLWYFRINQRVKLQQLTLETMLKIYEQNGGYINWPEINKLIK